MLQQQRVPMFLALRLVSPLTLSCLSCTNAAIASFVCDSKMLIEMLHVRLEREFCFSKERLLGFCESLSFSLSLSSRPKTEAMPEAKRCKKGIVCRQVRRLPVSFLYSQAFQKARVGVS